MSWKDCSSVSGVIFLKYAWFRPWVQPCTSKWCPLIVPDELEKSHKANVGGGQEYNLGSLLHSEPRQHQNILLSINTCIFLVQLSWKKRSVIKLQDLCMRSIERESTQSPLVFGWCKNCTETTIFTHSFVLEFHWYSWICFICQHHSILFLTTTSRPALTWHFSGKGHNTTELHIWGHGFFGCCNE